MKNSLLLNTSSETGKSGVPAGCFRILFARSGDRLRLGLLLAMLVASADRVGAEKPPSEPANAATRSNNTEGESLENGAESDGEKDEESKDNENNDEESDRETLTIQLAPFKISHESDVRFVASKMAPVKLEPKAWEDFEIVEVVSHGATVRQGEVVVRFDGKELKEAIEELELNQRLEELALIQSEQELPRLEKSIRENFERAERTLAEALLDYDHYQQTGRDLMLQGIEMSLQGTQQHVESVREELRQLEKMYEADDLTEETEEIILKRQRAAVEQAEYSLKQAKVAHARNLEVFVPRYDIQEKEYVDDVRMELERARTAMETEISQARYELEKARREQAESLEKHAELTSDLGQLTLRAPSDGVVYYGECEEGEWTEMADLVGSLQPKESVEVDSIVMTIVQPRPLYALSSVEESHRPSVRLGLSASIQPTAIGSAKLSATISQLSSIPVDDDKFSMELKLHGNDQPEWLVAGMTGKVKITTYAKAEAIVVPQAAVHEDETNDDSNYVWIVQEGDLEKRPVVTGRTKGDDIEITDGLEEGEVLSLEEEDDKVEDEDQENEDKDDEDE